MIDKGKEIILELEHIVKRYRTRGSFFGTHGKDVIALDQVSIRVVRGEIFGLVGESGSGKTTAGRLIVRLEEPEEGKIYLDSNEIAALKGNALREFDAVSEPLIIHKIGNAEARKDSVWQAMKSVGLSPPDDFAHRYPHQLSGGQRQRVAIARAMILKPEFVVADEPTSMLDASISAQIFNILLEMREKLHVSFLFITHSLAAARYLCDRIAVIYRGNLVEMGPGDEVIQNPKHPYTQALIDALPKFGYFGEVRRYQTLLRAERETSEYVGCPFFGRCKVADETKCRREKPPLKRLGDSHSVACFHTDPGVKTGSGGKE
jgi:peptide/nickel transport system ATP-binding protein